MIKVAPILYTCKTLSNGEHPVMIRLTLKGKRKYIGLGVNCKASYWDEVNNLPSKKHPQQKELTLDLQTQENQNFRTGRILPL
jgi:hypothetical protein